MYRPKLRSLARGWGKTATGGDVMSLLWAPGVKQTSGNKSKLSTTNTIDTYKVTKQRGIQKKTLPARAASVISSEYPPSRKPEATPYRSCLKSSACIYKLLQIITSIRCSTIIQEETLYTMLFTYHHTPSPQKECSPTSRKSHWARL